MVITGMQICVWMWVAFLVIWLIWAIRTKPTQTRESVSSRLSYIVLTIAAFGAMFGSSVPEGWLRTRLFAANLWTEVPGVVITAAGIGFAVWARVYLAATGAGGSR